MVQLHAAIRTAAQDPYRTSEAEEERLFELGSQGYDNPQSRDIDIREAKIKILDIKDIIRDFKRELGALEAQKREISGQYSQARHKAGQAKAAHESAAARVAQVKAQIRKLNAQLGIVPTAEEEALAEQGPIKRFI